MILEHCNMKMVSERGGAIVEFTDQPEPNIIEMVFRNESGDKVRISLDITAAIDAAVDRWIAKAVDVEGKINTSDAYTIDDAEVDAKVLATVSGTGLKQTDAICYEIVNRLHRFYCGGTK